MKKHIIKLDNIPEDNYYLIGISSHENDYRISWAINNTLFFNFIKKNNYSIFDNKHGIKKEFSQYEYINEEIFIKHLLISNQGNLGYLIPELKNIDFFIVLLDKPDDTYANNLIQKLRQVDIISMAYLIDISTLKSKSNLVFNE